MKHTIRAAFALEAPVCVSRARVLALRSHQIYSFRPSTACSPWPAERRCNEPGKKERKKERKKKKKKKKKKPRMRSRRKGEIIEGEEDKERNKERNKSILYFS